MFFARKGETSDSTPQVQKISVDRRTMVSKHDRHEHLTIVGNRTNHLYKRCYKAHIQFAGKHSPLKLIIDGWKVWKSGSVRISGHELLHDFKQMVCKLSRRGSSAPENPSNVSNPASLICHA